VSSGPGDEAAIRRRLDAQTWRLSIGVTTLDETMGEIARIHGDAHGDCLDQVLPALAGEAGMEAVGILRAARLSCESDGLPPASSALAQCIHARKLELFTQQRPADSPGARETLDRLLRVGGSAPLPPALREEYCGTRELWRTGHPLCE
jgi:hypothetical protein